MQPPSSKIRTWMKQSKCDLKSKADSNCVSLLPASSSNITLDSFWQHTSGLKQPASTRWLGNYGHPAEEFDQAKIQSELYQKDGGDILSGALLLLRLVCLNVTRSLIRLANQSS